LIDRNTPTTLNAATDLGVLRSTDSGASFLPTGLANTPVAFLAIDPFHLNVFYAATSNNPYPLDVYPPGLVGMYKSTDSGATWSPINQGLDEIVAAHAPVNALVLDPDRRTSCTWPPPATECSKVLTAAPRGPLSTMA
jgi:hypothetical protein